MNQKDIDELAIKWNKTKDPKYKEQWYKAVKEYARFLVASGQVSALE